jgi:hypothetical protein
MSDKISPERTELLVLRARMVVAEQAALAALEAMLLIRPEQLTTILESTRKRLGEGYLDTSFATDLPDPDERAFVANEVERLMRALQAEMGFPGGISSSGDG